MTEDAPVTAAQRLIELAGRLGVKYIFANLGSDHPAFIEAFAKLDQPGKSMPRIIICPHEMTALSAAHGCSMITRQPQLVLVHVDVGTQNLGGSVHNAARGRVPAIIVAGLSPVTDGRGRVGSRNEFIHYIQDTPRQHEIVSQYMKWCYELRAPETVDKVLLRGMQIAMTPPEGPVYVTGAREVWDAGVPVSEEDGVGWPPAQVSGISEQAVAEIYRSLRESRRPLVITSYLGRQTRAVELMVRLSEKIGIGVCEVSPQYLNFPGDHPNQLGYSRNAFVDEADLILLIDVDVPWIPARVRPAPGTTVFHIDADPLKQNLGYWHFPARGIYQADSLSVLEQLLGLTDVSTEGLRSRREWINDARARSGGMLPDAAARLGPSRVSAPSQSQPALPSTHASSNFQPATCNLQTSVEELTRAVRELITERTVIVAEAPSATELIPSLLRLNRPGSYFTSGGSALGWGINAAIGARLANPESEVITLVGDGCYQFGVPSSAYWTASTYKTPHLTIIYNNGGWNSPKLSTSSVHPEGKAAQTDRFWVTMSAGARLADIAAASGDVAAYTVKEPDTLRQTLRSALESVRSGRSAVVDVTIEPVSSQLLG